MILNAGSGAIPSDYKKVQIISDGTLTTDNGGNATVNCGFQPDVVFITLNTEDESDSESYDAVVDFSLASSNMCNSWLWVEGENVVIYGFDVTRTTTGFSVYIYSFNWTWDSSSARNKTFTYSVVKYS